MAVSTFSSFLVPTEEAKLSAHKNENHDVMWSLEHYDEDTGPISEDVENPFFNIFTESFDEMSPVRSPVKMKKKMLCKEVDQKMQRNRKSSFKNSVAMANVMKSETECEAGMHWDLTQHNQLENRLANTPLVINKRIIY